MRRHPQHVKHDLSQLTDAELIALARILPKLGGATGSEPMKVTPIEFAGGRGAIADFW
jgi:hypothetical protein